jgi:hypothetical protein
MPRTAPEFREFRYRVSRSPDGTVYVGRFADGRPYYNVIAAPVSGGVANDYRVVARCASLADAQALVAALDRYAIRATDAADP